jgi:hypothetical protein
MKMNSRSKSSGQVIVILIIVLGLVGVGFWWLVSNKQEMAREGKQFARDATQRIVVQRDINFFNLHLSPQARMNFPASAQQDFMNEIASMGAPVGAIDVKGEIEFNSQFFEPHGSFQARINYPARYADLTLLISHPVGRWQIDNISFLKQRER